MHALWAQGDGRPCGRILYFVTPARILIVAIRKRLASWGLHIDPKLIQERGSNETRLIY